MKKTPGRKPRSSPAGRAVLKGKRSALQNQANSTVSRTCDLRWIKSAGWRWNSKETSLSVSVDSSDYGITVEGAASRRYLKRDGANLLSPLPPRIPANNRICIMDELNPKKAD